MANDHNSQMSDELAMGRLVRLARHRLRLRQEDLAEQAEISRRVLVDIEAGRFDVVRVGELAAVGAILELRLVLDWRAKRGDLHALTDIAHAALVEEVVGRLARSGWETRVEAVSASGAIDVLAFHPEHRMLLVVEVKTRIVDIQRTLREIGYRRAAWRRAAEEQGWDARAVSTLLVILDTSAQRRLIARHRGIFDSALPIQGRQARAWLMHPTAPGGALLFMSIVQGQHGIHVDSVRVRQTMRERKDAGGGRRAPKRGCQSASAQRSANSRVDRAVG